MKSLMEMVWKRLTSQSLRLWNHGEVAKEGNSLGSWSKPDLISCKAMPDTSFIELAFKGSSFACTCCLLLHSTTTYVSELANNIIGVRQRGIHPDLDLLWPFSDTGVDGLGAVDQRLAA